MKCEIFVIRDDEGDGAKRLKWKLAQLEPDELVSITQSSALVSAGTNYKTVETVVILAHK